MKIIDNSTDLFRDNLISSIKNDDKIAIAASCFSMYAFKELMEQFKSSSETRFIFTSSDFIKNNNAKLVYNKYEDSLFGTEFENKLQHALSQKAVAKEFAEWVKREGVQFKANITNDKISGFTVVASQDKKIP